MKRVLFAVVLLASQSLLFAQGSSHQQGNIVRMRMTDCLTPQHGFMAAMSGSGRVEPGAMCPEYVLVADKIVFVISGKGSDQLIPLAETTSFRLQKNELLIRIDDASKESHFQIKAMVLRPEWERNQMLQEAESMTLVTQRVGVSGAAMGQ